jgi:hypothetical protein
MLVSDISSVITDFLASGKPYAVTNPAGISDEVFRSAFPSARGAYILSGDGRQVGACVVDAREVDSLADDRRQTVHYLLGDVSIDPVARFNQAVETVLDLQRTDTARRSR